MPDIKTALNAALFRAPSHAVVQKTLKEWDDEGEGAPVEVKQTRTPIIPVKRGPVTVNNVTRTTFSFIQQNPGLRTSEISAQLEAQGFKRTSVKAVVSQLQRSGQVANNGNGFYTIVPEYQIIRIERKLKPAKASRKIVKSSGINTLPRQDSGIAALTASPMPMPVLAPAPATAPELFDPKKYIGPLTVYQARDVYDELKKMFGG
jgi:hypothetical protein